MLLQVEFRVFLLMMIAYSVQSKRYQPKFCAECEEEVWEEVPCDQIYPSSPTTAATPVIPAIPITRPIPITTTPPPITSPTYPSTSILTIAPTLSSLIYPITSTASPPVYATIKNSTAYPPESSDGYKKCYCECKAGCREFCRKVVLYPEANKQIVQLSKTIHQQGNGHVEVKHLHERNFVPSPPSPPSPPLPDNISINPCYRQQQQPPKLSYIQPKATYNAAPNPPPTIVNNALPYDISSLGFSPEEISKLLNSDQEYSNVVPKMTSYPVTNLAALPNPPQGSSSYNPSQVPIPPQVPLLIAKTAASSGSVAAATAKTTNNYKGSPSTNLISSPCSAKYKSDSISQNALQNLEPVIDNYLRDVLYSYQHKGSRILPLK